AIRGVGDPPVRDLNFFRPGAPPPKTAGCHPLDPLLCCPPDFPGELLRIPPFKMERMQSTYENYVEYNLSESGVHPLRAEELLGEGGEAAKLLATELGYCQSNGTEELRRRIALFYPEAVRENVLVTNGGAEANYATFWTLLERGDRVALQIPNYVQTPGLSAIYAGPADRFRLVRRREHDRTRGALDL